MIVCQICGDRGYSHLLINCTQCQNVSVHRYCVAGPAVSKKEGFKWSCEECVLENTKPVLPCRKSGRLIPTVKRITSRNVARKKQRYVLPSEVQNPVVPLKETAEVTTKMSIRDQNNNNGSVRRKEADNEEHRNPVRQHDVLDATEDIHEEKKCNYDLKEESSEAFRIRRRKIKYTNSSDDCEQVKHAQNVDPLPCKVQNLVEQSTPVDGFSKYSKAQNLRDLSVPWKEIHIDKNVFSANDRGRDVSGSEKSSRGIHPEEIFEEIHISKKFSRDSDRSDHADNKKSEVEDSKVHVSDRKAPGKKRFIIEMEYSDDEEPVFFVAKRPQHAADVDKVSFKSSSESVSKLSDVGVAQISSVESAPLRPSSMEVDDRVLSREKSVVADNHGLTQPSPVKSVNNVPTEPLTDVPWRGCCRIREYSTPLGLEAHLSNKAHENVQNAVLTLPELLNFDFVSKKYEWPKYFEKSGLTGNDIGLYLFPVDERDEKQYKFIIDKMFEDGLMLKSVLNDLELLVFCSLELPREERTYRRNYYLWGVFKPRKDEPTLPNNLHSSSPQLPKPTPSPVSADYSRNGIYHPKDVATSRAINTSSCRSVLVDNIHVHQKDARLPAVESSRPISAKPFKRPHDTQRCNSHQRENRNRHVLYREDYCPHPRKHRKTEDHERRCNGEVSDYDREHNWRWRNRTLKWKDRGSKDSRCSYGRY